MRQRRLGFLPVMKSTLSPTRVRTGLLEGGGDGRKGGQRAWTAGAGRSAAVSTRTEGYATLFARPTPTVTESRPTHLKDVA